MCISKHVRFNSSTFTYIYKTTLIEVPLNYDLLTNNINIKIKDPKA